MKIIKMRYLIEPRDKIYVKGYWFFSLAKNAGKNLSNKNGQKLLDSAKRSTTDAIKTASKRAIQRTAEGTGAEKITSVSKKSTKELQNNEAGEDVERATTKKRYISTEKRQQIIDELRLVWQYNNGISKNSKFSRQCIK